MNELFWMENGAGMASSLVIDDKEKNRDII